MLSSVIQWKVYKLLRQSTHSLVWCAVLDFELVHFNTSNLKFADFVAGSVSLRSLA